MSEYLVTIVGIVAAFATITTVAIIIAVIKGLRAGKTDVEICIFGVIRFSVHLSDISCKKLGSSRSERKEQQ